MTRDMAFFKNTVQTEGLFGGETAKIPIFYYDGAVLTGIFPAKMSALKKMMPSAAYHPAPLLPGIGAIAVTCFEYRDTDIRPYNEISIAVPITYKHASLVPGFELVSGLLKNEFHVYVRHLPVTTQIALDAGVMLYNYPKFLSTIEFERGGGEIKVTLAENGEMILRVTAKDIAAQQSKMYRYVTYPHKDNCAQHADVLVNALEFGQSAAGNTMKIELGKHSISKELDGALVSRSALIHQSAPRFQAILYGPNRLE